jgi:hypothetical protein
VTDARTLAHLLEFDSTYGRLGAPVAHGPELAEISSGADLSAGWGADTDPG